MQINWLKEKIENDYRIQYGLPTPDFWKAWRGDKESLASIGVSLITAYSDDGKSTLYVRRVSRVDLTTLPASLDLQPYVYMDRSKLKPYQIEPVSHIAASLISHRVAFDASDTGTGKTYTALKTCCLLGLIPAIICTKSGISQWKTACKFYGLTPLFIVNWESSIGRIYRRNNKIISLTQPNNLYIKMAYDKYNGSPLFKWFIDQKNVCVIFDEIHNANGDGSYAELVYSAHKQGLLILGLSATLCDVLPKFRLIGTLTGALKNTMFTTWLKEQGCYINRYDRWAAVDEKNVMLKINKFLFPAFGARVKKSDVKDFPTCQNMAVLYTIDNTAAINKAYEECQAHILALHEKANQLPTDKKNQTMVLRLRYRQIAEMQKVPLFLSLIKEYIENGYSVIVFVNFDETLKSMAKLAKTKAIICGGQSEHDRRQIIDALKKDKIRFILANAQAGGTAIDGLQDHTGKYKRVAIISPSDNAVLLKQTIGRVHRSNSATHSINILAYAANTIEEKVYENVKNKLNNIDILNDGDLAEDESFTNTNQ